jgi:hypothetical protein
VLAFHTGALLELQDAELRLACFRAYNDFLVDFASADSRRLIPLMMLPIWDVDACIAEMQRETDYPHPTSLAPGPASYVDNPAAMVRRHLAPVALDVARKVLHDNAAKVYGLD